MRFDDVLDTVLAVEVDTPFAARAAWRQIVDLVGRGRADADPATLDALERLRGKVGEDVRAASARALDGAAPPAALVALLATDSHAVAAPVLRGATLAPAEWVALLPRLTPAGRSILRHRRDLDGVVVQALDGYRPVDFVLPAADPAEPPRVPAETPVPMAPVADDFRPIGDIAQAVIADVPTPTADAPGETFRIADVVARIEAFQRAQEHGAPPPAVADTAAGESFSFETDHAGTIRHVDGVARGALLGLSLAQPARPAGAGVDGAAAGAFARRTRFVDAHLLVAGQGEAAGAWRVSAAPLFERVSGRFTGYAGRARRPRAEEAPGRAIATPRSDAMRQVAHELRTPTGAIAGFSEMIEHQVMGPVDPVYRIRAGEMRRDAQGLLGAIEDIDTAARIAGGALHLRAEAVPLAPVLSRIAADLAPLAAERSAALVSTGTPGVVQGDARALHRLIERLAATMLALAGPGERIAMTAEDALVAIDRPRALAGMDDAALFAIDEPGNPVSLLGTGFALRLARNLARELGGRLEIGAAALTLRLPAAGTDAMGRQRQN